MHWKCRTNAPVGIFTVALRLYSTCWRREGHTHTGALNPTRSAFFALVHKLIQMKAHDSYSIPWKSVFYSAASVSLYWEWNAGRYVQHKVCRGQTLSTYCVFSWFFGRIEFVRSFFRYTLEFQFVERSYTLITSSFKQLRCCWNTNVHTLQCLEYTCSF